jgi:hypothetical protein
MLSKVLERYFLDKFLSFDASCFMFESQQAFEQEKESEKYGFRLLGMT